MREASEGGSRRSGAGSRPLAHGRRARRRSPSGQVTEEAPPQGAPRREPSPRCAAPRKTDRDAGPRRGGWAGRDGRGGPHGADRGLGSGHRRSHRGAPAAEAAPARAPGHGGLAQADLQLDPLEHLGRRGDDAAGGGGVRAGADLRAPGHRASSRRAPSSSGPRAGAAEARPHVVVEATGQRPRRRAQSSPTTTSSTPPARGSTSAPPQASGRRPTPRRSAPTTTPPRPAQAPGSGHPADEAGRAADAGGRASGTASAPARVPPSSTSSTSSSRCARPGVRDRARLVFLTNEAELGDFGVGGVHLQRGGYRVHSKTFAESLYAERGIEWITGAHVQRVEPAVIHYETLDGEEHTLAVRLRHAAPALRRAADQGVRRGGRRPDRRAVRAQRLHEGRRRLHAPSPTRSGWPRTGPRPTRPRASPTSSPSGSPSRRRTPSPSRARASEARPSRRRRPAPACRRRSWPRPWPSRSTG